MSGPAKYRRLPTEITARQLDMGDYDEACEIVRWSQGRAVEDGIEITTLHGDTAIARDGDWIAAEPEPGRFYPIKPDIFAATYEAVSE